MFDIELKSGKRKRKSPGLQQPLPVPIASLTGIKANDAIWRFYHGKWNQGLLNNHFNLFSRDFWVHIFTREPWLRAGLTIRFFLTGRFGL